MTRLFSFGGGLVVAATILQGQSPSSDGLWQPIVAAADRLRAFSADLGQVNPTRLAAFKLSTGQLLARLAKAGRTLTDDSPTISLPMPDGTYLNFQVQETEVMSKELADSLKFRTYRGRGVRNRRVTTRFEYGPEGLRALVFTTDGRVFIEPVVRPEPAYVSYSVLQPQNRPSPQANANPGPPRCQVTAEDAERMRTRFPVAVGRPEGSPQRSEPPGTLLRTYRLAVGATAEYVKFHGGTVDSAARAIGATMQRVNEVYENDLGISFRLVSSERDLIHTNAATDPYTNDDADKLLTENQRFLDTKIGSGNYDIGHVLSTGAGGKAFAGVCNSSFKGQGATGKATPVGDPFDIDYVAHEIGHQFGANHTFNTTLGACGSRNRFARTAFEPGSGSTVLGYAGICAEGDLQRNSQAYFHAGTLREIRDFLIPGPGGSCATTSSTHNTPPVATVAPSAVTIPRSTPFRLTGSAKDAEEPALLYTWEELDLGVSAPPEGDGDGYPRPLFRSYAPSSAETRVFPALDVIQSLKPRIGETLPMTARRMVFRFTARDASNPAGGFGFADVAVKVADAGPLTVTKPAAGAIVAAGSSLAIAWTVNGTDKGDVVCTHVKLRLSLDDAASIAFELLPSTLNDGAESATIPVDARAGRARVLVECASQPFFGISNPFTIKPPTVDLPSPRGAQR